MNDTENRFPKPSAQLLVKVFEEFGVRDVVLSPGTRNAPLLLAFSASATIRCHTVIDERTAAFFALGIASCSRRPVGLICTSGSAMLNYAPALSEAYYRNIPLIAVSADRPKEWIDQSDNQTIRQARALDAVVKASVEIPDFSADDTKEGRYASRLLCDILSVGMTAPKGPIHINMPFDLPLGLDYLLLQDSPLPRVLSDLPSLSTEKIKNLVRDNIEKNILVVCGFMSADNRLNKAFHRLSTVPGVVVVAEPLANLHADTVITNVDATVAELPEKAVPDLVIVCGGSLVSDKMKHYLRSLKTSLQWYVGPYDGIMQDTFRSLSLTIDSSPETFFPAFASLLLKYRKDKSKSAYNAIWKEASERGKENFEKFIQSAPWTEIKAVSLILEKTPKDFNVHLSNGTAVRYAMLHASNRQHELVCNRGVSGIEGSTSTAIGAASCYGGPTLLISGDMSFSYDIGALALKGIPDNFKAIVLSNDGGGIFRAIDKTASLPNREEIFCQAPRLPLEALAKAYDFGYTSVDSEEALSRCLKSFFENNSSPQIMELKFDAELSAKCYIDYKSTL